MPFSCRRCQLAAVVVVAAAADRHLPFSRRSSVGYRPVRPSRRRRQRRGCCCSPTAATAAAAAAAAAPRRSPLQRTLPAADMEVS